jgi:DNA-binding beta-propeller fold protein YncE
MGSRQIGLWLLTGILIAVAGILFWKRSSTVRDNRVPTNVAYVSEEDGGISVIDLSTLKVIRKVQPNDLSPRGLAVTLDGKYLITSNKNTSDIAVFSTPKLDLLKRIHIGESPEFIKINPAGDRAFATFEPSSKGGPPAAAAAGQPQGGSSQGTLPQKAGGAGKAEASDENDNGPPAQIATFHIGDWVPGPVSTAGQETEGIEFSRDGKLMMVSNESQENIGVFDEVTGQHLRDVNLKPYGIRPRGLKVSPQGNEYAVTMEGSGTLLTLDPNFNLIKSVPTGAKPYGVAFDRAGKRIFVSAAQAAKLQVFSADSLQLLAEVPTGKRCWHFTFTPDDSKVLLACGRSNNVVVIDANSYQPLGTIEGFKLPWGIVTYPRSYGSLGLP